MAPQILKSAIGLPDQSATDTSDTVAIMLARLKQGGEAAAIDYAQRLDGWEGDIPVSPEHIAAATHQIGQPLKDAINYAHENITRFAEAQLSTCADIEVELRPGLIAGQRQIPLDSAGAYVPGGRYAHIASALMTITTARVAGVRHITACSPPKAGQGIPAPILYAMDLAGATRILSIGGVQGVAAMAQGLFGCIPADILIGPGNQYVAEAKRQLYGPTGIDMFAGPTDSMVLADHGADPFLVAWDLVGQAEHGANSPVWLATTHRALAEQVIALVPRLIETLPASNGAAARAAWDTLAEVILCDSAGEMADYANQKGPEHLHVQAENLDWWRKTLTSYGSLFLGEHTTVAFGDKAAGPNHVLPTSGAARYTGGLSVHKFLKTVTWQRAEAQAIPDLARACATISRFEGMEGHARTADIRLEKFAPTPRLAVGNES